MHESDSAPYRFAVCRPEGALHFRDPIRVCRNRFGVVGIEQHLGEQGVRAQQAVEQREWIGLRPALAATDRDLGDYERLREEIVG